MTTGRVSSTVVDGWDGVRRPGAHGIPLDTPPGTATDVGTPAADGVAPIEADLPGAVTDDLAAFLAVKRAACVDVAEEFVEAADDLLALVLSGGKRLRPTFAWWAWRAAGGLGGVPAAAVLRATSALELVQGCALVHDDLIDDSATRRGEPTVHARWQARHRAGGWVGSPDRLGAAVAVLVGDVALAWADDMLRDAALDPAVLARVTPVWEAMRTEVLAGQFLDVVAHATDASSPEAALRISRYKTAAYTVERPMHLGAALAGADDAVVAAYRGFGVDLGIAFQLRDDLLGVFGDPAVTGKPAGDDLREGKRTLLVALARHHPDTARAAAVERALGVADLDADTLAAARDALVDLGVVDEVEARIDALTASGLAALDTVDLDTTARGRLTALAVAATRRTS